KGEERIPALTAGRAMALAYAGETRRALAAIADVPRVGRYSGFVFYDEACILALAAASAAKDGEIPQDKREELGEQHAARAMSDLAAARRTGYFRDASKVALIRSDHDLDPLRPRPDFQRLVMDLAFPADPFVTPR